MRIRLIALAAIALSTTATLAPAADSPTPDIANLRERTRLVMGPAPGDTDKPPLDVRVVEATETDHYTRKRITFQVESWDRLPAWLLIPHQRDTRLPAMLCLHPTSPHGKDVVVGIQERPNRNYAEELAERGYVVLAPDYPGFGEYVETRKRLYENGYTSCTMKGIVNHRRCIDLLQSLPEVNPSRIGCIGHSLGGHNTLFLAAFDDRVKAMVTSCGFTAFARYKGGDLTGWTHDGYMPAIATQFGKDPARMPFDFPELLAALAPRALFVNAPTGDDNFDVDGVRTCVETAEKAYALHNSAERLVAAYPDAAHDFPPAIREQAYTVLDAALKGEPGPASMFHMDGAASIMDEEHLGLVNGAATIGINHTRVGSIGGLWTPPHVSSDFLLELHADGAPIKTAAHRWMPYAAQTEGVSNGVAYTAEIILPPRRRCGLMRITCANTGAEPRDLNLQLVIKGTLDTTPTWEFARAASATPAPAAVDANVCTKTKGPLAIVVAPSIPAGQWDAAAETWQLSLHVDAQNTATFDVAFALGDAAGAHQACTDLLRSPGAAIKTAHEDFAARVGDMFARLPRLESDNPALDAFYNRSLIHLLTNRWDVAEFVLHPYYSTGSVKGGCLCEYLWNFGEVWEILPLYDPQAARGHILQFLKTDITTHFAFMPVDGNAFGPHYPVNQEKIIGLIYYYVLLTGDTAFLQEPVAGKNVLEWVLANALFGDDPTAPVALIDYGPSNSHLELRRGIPYNHVMPDLNARRYDNYLRAAELARIAGAPAPHLAERAAALKTVVAEKLWDPQAKWFRFLNADGTPDLRYTIQIFKLFGSGVLDDAQTAGLLAHLNETEFLSAQGLHSMAKTDPAYDQVDIDNGGGGACTCFPPQIAERLYRAGHAAPADDILRRILWWGERMPYWGDSLVANSIDYRKDTPLQCTLDGATVAQCIIFGLFGVSTDFDGALTVRPNKTTLANQLILKGLRLRGHTIDIACDAQSFQVTHDGKTTTQPYGNAIKIP